METGAPRMIDWEGISREHGPLVWRTACRLLGGRGSADAADCFQETFLTALDVSRRQVVRNWPALLQRIATMRALDMLRRRIREKSHVNLLEEINEAPSDRQSPAQRLQDQELQQQLRAALAQLPAAQSEVFCLRHLSDMSYEQIASEMNMTVDNVGVTLHRAKARLRELLTQRGHAPANAVIDHSRGEHHV